MHQQSSTLHLTKDLWSLLKYHYRVNDSKMALVDRNDRQKNVRVYSSASVCYSWPKKEREIKKIVISQKNIGEIPSEWEKKARTEWKQVYWIQFGQWRCEWERSLYITQRWWNVYFFFFKFSLLNFTQINGDERKAYDISYANLKWLESVKCFL